MLDERIIEVLVERLVNRIEQGNTYVLEQIGKSIKRIGTLSPTSAYQLGQVLKYGGNFDKIVQKLMEITNINISEIYEIFEEVAKENQLFAKQFYDYKNIKYIPFEKNFSLQRQVRAIAMITAGTYENLSKTTAFMRKDINGRRYFTNLSKTYQDIIDEAVLSVKQGKTTFSESMYKSIKELGESGIRTVDYSTGYSRRLDSAIRMNLKDGLRDMSIEIQKQFGEEFGADGIEVSHHVNSAPDHIDTIDGKQFTKEEFEAVNSSLVRHVGELNCYHYIFPIVLGVSEPEYSKEQIEKDKERNMQGCDIDGKHYTLYEAEQLMRRLEAELRKAKDIQIIGKASGNKDIVEYSQKRISKLTSKYRQVAKISGIPTKLERARVSGYRRKNVKKML